MADRVTTLRELLIEELQDLYDAEHRLTKAIPDLIKGSTSAALREGLQAHLGETEGQVTRLEQVFSMLGEEAERKTCKAMKGLIEEGSEAVKLKGDPSVRDAAIIVAAQKVEHYEMAGYGSCRTFAELLGLSDVAAQLQQTLDEESAADDKLTEVAQTVNVEAEMRDEIQAEIETGERAGRRAGATGVTRRGDARDRSGGRSGSRSSLRR